MLEDMNCCGVREACGISRHITSHRVIQEICGDIWDDSNDINFAFIIFTDTSDSTSGRRLCKYIRANKLGEVIESKYGFNPNSGNKVKVWTWRIDRRKLEKWRQNNKPKYDDDIDPL